MIIQILMTLDDDLEIVYKKYNKPGATKLLALSKRDGLKVTLPKIQEFLNAKSSVQQLKETKVTKRSLGTIVSYAPFELMQIDIFILDKYKGNNKNYADILAIVDVFSRKVWCYPLKGKSLKDTTPAISQFFKDADIKKNTLVVMMSDSDGAFKGDNRDDTENFQQVLNNHNAVLDPVKNQDHHALGIIDAFAKNLKRTLTKEFLDNKNTNWIDHLKTIVSNYNDTPHESLDMISPNEVLNNVANQIKVLHINMDKNKKNMTASDLVEGDKVRVSITNTFKKGTEPRWSNEVYDVASTKGKSVNLTDGTMKKRSNVLKVPSNTISTGSNVVDVATKVHKVKQQLKREDIVETRVTDTKRVRVPKKFADDTLAILPTRTTRK